MKDFYVYLHRRATDGKVFYVGKGRGNRAKDKSNGRSNWWKNIVAKHGCIVEFYETGLQEWYAIELEIQLIAYYGRENLCNLTDGGEGMSGWKPTKETIEKRVAKTTGKKRTEETKRKISEARTGFKPKPESIEKMKKSKSGFRHTEETKQKISEIVSNRIVSDETREKISKSRIGIKYSEETINKMSDAKSKPVLCSNGMIFKSSTEAAKWLSNNGWPKASHSGVSQAARGVTKTAYGYTWKRIKK